MPFLREFHCPACDVRFEDLVSSSSVHSTQCPTCGAASESVVSAPKVGAYQMMDQKGRSEVLRKRSHDDTIRQLKKEPEKYGFAAADKRPWNIRSTPKASS